MTDYQSTIPDRSALTFSIEGLSARDELLFKSFVRLLDHLTHQQWTYQSAAATQRVDLLVVANGVQPTPCPRTGQEPQSVLRIVANGANGPGYLTWPLNPGALEVELNRLGFQIIGPLDPKQSPAALRVTAAGHTQADLGTVQLMRLLKWPSSNLLAGTGRMRLATLLAGRAMSLEEIVTRSSLPLQICQAFIDDLQRAQLLSTSREPKPVSIADARLGIAAIQRTAPSPKVVQPGLLNRIRMRLGIKSPSQT